MENVNSEINLQNDPVNNQPQNAPKKSNTGKIILIILIILIVIGAGGYLFYKYYIISNSKEATPTQSSELSLATIEGTTENMTVEIPNGFTVTTSEDAKTIESDQTNPIVVIYKNKEDLDKGKLFGLVFMGENKDNNYQIKFDKTKKVFDKLNASKPENKVTEETINNYRLLKNDGKISDTVWMTEYHIFTNKSTFIINRTYSVGETPYEQTAFDKMVYSFKILPK